MAETVISWRDCSVCGGSGEVELLTDAHGNPDYLFGSPGAGLVPCQYCDGTGQEPDEVSMD